MKTIFCPVDFSNESIKAAEWAALLAIKAQSRLILFHRFLIFPDGDTRDDSQDVLRDAQKEAETRLSYLKDSLISKFNGIESKFTIDTALGIDIEDVIVAAAEKSNADLIVMGTNGAESFSDIIGGSNTTNVIEETKIPVIAIPDTAAANLPHTIIYATDLKDEDYTNLSFVLDFAYILDAKLIFLHINEKGDTTKLAKLKEVISSQIAYNSNIGKVSKTSYDEVKGDDLFASLQQYSNNVKAEMMVLGRHPRNFFERLIKGDSARLLVLYSTVPLMVVHKKQ